MTLPEPHEEQPTPEQSAEQPSSEQQAPPNESAIPAPESAETPESHISEADIIEPLASPTDDAIPTETPPFSDPPQLTQEEQPAEAPAPKPQPEIVAEPPETEPSPPQPEIVQQDEPITNGDGLTEEENRAMLEMFLALPPLNGEDNAPPHPQTLKDQVLAAIDMDGLLETLDQWLSIRSLDGTPAENIAQEKVADTMRQIGLDVEMWEFTYADVQDHPSFCVEVERSRSIGVVGKFGAGNETGRSLILNGHTDVVPVGDLSQWTVPPWEVTVRPEENRVYGRGALDMKGNLACGLYAIKAIKDAGIELDGQVLLQSVVGEEDGGVGTLAAVVRGYTADAAIVLEPTELMIAPAQAGALNFRVTIPGYPAHGAMRNEGVDPLEKFLLIYQSILTFEKVRNANVEHPLFEAYELPYPICCGTIQGGNWASTVAESLTFEGRLGVAVDEEPAAARRAFEELIGKTAMADPWLRKHPPTVAWWGGQFAPAAIRENHPIVKTVEEALQTITKSPPTIQGMTYGADMRLLVNDGGIPTILFGAGDVRKAHQFDEYVPLDELETVVKTIALTILEFCSVKQPE